MPDFTITIETNRIEHRDRIKNLILDLVKIENKKTTLHSNQYIHDNKERNQ